jgi:hypothetical protein
VSYSDALRIGLGDRKLSADDHRQAADELQKALPFGNAGDHTGIKHLRYLLSKKHLVAYGDQRLEQADYETLFTRAERFALWADRMGNQLDMEGWKHG